MMSERPCMVDGRECDCGLLPDGLFVYQEVRTAGTAALHCRRHSEILDMASREVLGFGIRTDAHALEGRIAALLARNGYPDDGLSFVTLRQYMSGEFVIMANAIFPYRQRKLRLLSPRAGVVDWDPPFTEHRTSASESAERLAVRQLQKYDKNVKCAIRRSRTGEAVSIDGSPFFIIENGEAVSPPPAVPSVEFEAAAEAIHRAGVPFSTAAIDTERLLGADELFFADCRGITAVSTYEDHLYIHLLAERVARFY